MVSLYRRGIKAAIIAIKTGTANIENRTHTFGMRPEQKEAVDKTIEYFASAKKDYPGRAPKFFGTPKCVSAKPLLPSAGKAHGL